MRREPVALLQCAWVLDERLYEKPLQLEVANPAAEIPFECIRGNESFASSLIAVCQGSLLVIKASFGASSEVKCVVVNESEVLDRLKEAAFAVFP